MNATVDDMEDSNDPVSRMGDYREFRKRARAVSGSGPRSPLSARNTQDEALFSARLWAAAEALGSGRPATAAQVDAAVAEAGTVSADDYGAWRRWKQQGLDKATQEEVKTNPNRRREREQATALRRAQSEKVAALRRERAEADQRASEKQELQRTISIKLQRKIAGRSFPKVLGAFGVPVPLAGGRADPEPAAMAKAYKKALIKYHPDRAARQGADFSIQLEMEETYKLLQNLHQEWQSQLEAGGSGQQGPSDHPPPSPASARRPRQGQEQSGAVPPRSWTEAGATGGPAARAAAAASVAARAARAAAAAASAHRASTASRGGDRAHAQAVQREAARRARWAAGAARDYGDTSRPMKTATAGGAGSGAGGMPFKQRSAYF